MREYAPNILVRLIAFAIDVAICLLVLVAGSFLIERARLCVRSLKSRRRESGG